MDFKDKIFDSYESIKYEAYPNTGGRKKFAASLIYTLLLRLNRVMATSETLDEDILSRLPKLKSFARSGIQINEK
jgi:hypothetical protein